ncbi:MAG TPA: protein translocase subunit SecF [Gammaproteobacteria bacterium]
MEFFKKQPNFDFMRGRFVAMAFSLTLVVASIVIMALRGFNFSIDFTGGVLLEVSYAEAVELEPIRDVLAEEGFPGAIVQHFGTTSDVMIRLQPEADKSNDALSHEVMDALQADNPDARMRRVEFVGPQVGEQLTNQGIQAALFALIGILIYVTMRFQWKLAVGAIVGIAHDCIVVLGMISLFQMPFDLTVLAAILTLIGYSLNDTVVVYDRLREDFRVQRSDNVLEITNIAINHTLSRTVMTGVTTLMVLTALFYFGGSGFYTFTLSLIFGIVFGTYSSVYVAAISALLCGLKREDLLPLKEKQPIDDMP